MSGQPPGPSRLPGLRSGALAQWLLMCSAGAWIILQVVGLLIDTPWA